MKILDFDLEGNHFIMEAEVSKRQKADDDVVCQWLRYLFENTQVYKETDGVVSPFRITGVAWAGYQLTPDHALRDVIGRISRNETGKLTVHYVCPELQEFLDMFKKYPAIHGERTIPYFIFHHGDIARLCYAEAFQQLLPDRPLIQVTGSTTTFAKRRALRRSLKETGNGILLCTQQSLPSSVNFEYVNKIILPELHYNNSGMSQFYMRFIRYTSTEFKDIYFLTYAGSLESNLMQMVVAKEKINLFMKGKDADLDEIYDKFGIDYNLLELLMRRELDEEGHFQIRWGEQLIA